MTRHAGSYAREIKAGTAAASPNGFLAWGVIVRTTTGPPPEYRKRIFTVFLLATIRLLM